MLRKVRKNYKRLVAFLLSAAMIITNVGGNAGTVFAAEGQEERESAIFMVDGQEILEAIQSLKDQAAFSKEDLEEMGLDASRKGVLKKYEKLLLPEEGKVYELALNINTELALEGTALQVFYNGKTKEVIFLYMNESGQSVDCYVNIDGYETKVVTVEANDANVTAGAQETTAGEETGEEPGNGSGGGSGSSGGGSGSTGGSGGSGSGGSGNGGSEASDGQDPEDGTSGEATEGSKEEASSADEESTPGEDADKASEEETKAEAPKEESKSDETGSSKEESKSEADEDGKEQPEKGTDGKDDKDEKESTDSDKAENGGEEADKKETESAKPEGSGQDKGTSDKDDSQKTEEDSSKDDGKPGDADSGKDTDKAEEDEGKEDADKSDGKDSKEEDSADKAGDQGSADTKDDKEDTADQGSGDAKGDSADKADGSDSKEDSKDKADDGGSKEDSADKANGGSDDASSDSSNDGGSGDRHDGNRLSLSMSRHQAGIVAIQLDEIQDEGEAEDEAEEETTTVEETEEETEEVTTTAKETEEETEKETKAEAVKEETEGKAAEEETTEKATEKETEAEATEKADQEETAKEESKAEETEKATETAAETKEAEKESVKAEESTELEMDSEQGAEATGESQEESKETQSQEEAETTVSEESADGTADESKEESSKAEDESKADGSGQGGADNSQSNGEELSDDWEIPGKVYDTVTIQETINARAYCVELQYVQKIVEATKGEEIVPQEYRIDYVINPGDAAKVKGDELAVEGESLYFAVEPEEGYEIISVYANGNALEAVEDAAGIEDETSWKGYSYVYRIEEISEDVDVEIEMAQLETLIPAAVYTAEIDDAIIAVDVPDGAFEEEVELKAVKIDGETELKELADQANDALKENQSIAALVAYDITFISLESGEEVEPLKPVAVSMSFKQAIVSGEEAEEAKGISVVHLPDSAQAETVATVENVEATEISFQADSFSKYMLALIMMDRVSAGGENYPTITLAAKEAKDGAVITLLEDITESVELTDRSFTFDLNGHTWTGKGKSALIANISRKDVSIAITGGGTIAADAGYRAVEMGKKSTANVYGNLTMTGIKLQGSGSAVSKTIVVASGTSRKSGGIVAAIDTNVVADSCEFLNGTAGDNGGAVVVVPYYTGSQVEASFTNCSFRENNAKYGGAISAEVIGSQTGRTLLLKADNCTFEGNTASSGGAIYLQSNNSGSKASLKAEITNETTFTENVASSYGGAIYYENPYYEDEALSIANSYFTQNKAKGYKGGGAIYTQASLNLSNVEFRENIVEDSGGKGGAVSIDNSKSGMFNSAIDETKFINNTSKGSGGALAIAVTASAGTIALNSTLFEGNQSTYDSNFSGNGGGAIHAMVKNGVNVNFSDTTIHDNTATWDGGAILADIKNLSVTDTKIYNNHAGKAGGGIYLKATQAGAQADFTQLEARGNTAQVNGGGVSLEGQKTGTATFESCTITNNTAEKNGGGIYSLLPEVTIKDTTVNGNTANGFYGGGVYLASYNGGGEFTVSGSTAFYGNKAPKDPKAVAFKISGNTPSADIFVRNCSTKSSSKSAAQLIGFDEMADMASGNITYRLAHTDPATQKYGNINAGTTSSPNYTACSYSVGYYCTKSVGDCVYLSPLGSAHSGSGNVITKTTLQAAVDSAKANKYTEIYVCGTVNVGEAEAKLLNESGIIFKRCSECNSTALFNISKGKNITFDNVKIDGDRILSSAALVNVEGVLTIAGNTDIRNGNNSSSNGGGAIYVDAGATLNINGGTIEDNVAARGGAIATGFLTPAINISGGSIKGNKASGDGGAIYSDSAVVRVNGGVIENNIADKSGGAICGYGLQRENDRHSRIYIEGGTFKDNSCAGNGGGAIYTHFSDLYIGTGENGERPLFESNRTSQLGGAIYLHYYSTGRIYRGDFKENKSVTSLSAFAGGGALYIDKSCSMEMKNLYLVGNKQSESKVGGAGLYTCSTGRTAIFKTEGAFIAENTALDGMLADINFIGGNYSRAYVSDYVLGGSAANWKTAGGAEAPNLWGTQESFTIVSHADSGAKATAKAMADADGVVMEGNYSGSYGAAIANNGSLTIGTEELSLTVNKVWNGGETKVPDEILVYLMKALNGGKSEKVTLGERDDAYVLLNQGNKWNYTWEGLGDSSAVDWSVSEAAINGYTGTITGPTLDNAWSGVGKHYIFTLTNTSDPNAKTAALKVTKKLRAGSEDPNARFDFTVSLDQEGSYAYRIVTDETTGALQPIYDDSSAIKIRLKAGESFIIEGIPVGTNYTVTEDSGDYLVYINGELSEGAKAEGTLTSEIGSVVELVYTNVEKTQVEAAKIWDDDDDRDGIRPEGITVQLVKIIGEGDGTPEKTMELNEGNGWSGTFENLPKYDLDGNPITWKIAELNAGNAYTSVITGDGETGFTVTNTHTPETVDISGEKTWDDADNQDGKRPASITVKLYANGEEVRSQVVTANADGSWNWEFNGLPKYYDHGKLIEYKFIEVLENESGYKPEITDPSEDNGYAGKIVNAFAPGLVDWMVFKIWEDGDDQDGFRPESITVQLKANGLDEREPVVLNAENNWNYTWKDLDEYRQGEKIQYTVEEISQTDAYSVNITNEFSEGTRTGISTITNTHTPETTVIKAVKEWDDQNNQDGIRPEGGVSVQLMADGTAQGEPVILDGSNDWTYQWENLPVYREGKKIDYAVSEVSEINGYLPIYQYNREEGVITVMVTNVHLPEVKAVKAVKVWDDQNNQDGLRPEGVEMQLMANGVPEGNPITLNAGNNWTYEWRNLPVYQGGSQIDYTVVENTKVDQYSVSYSYDESGNALTVITITNSHKPEETTPEETTPEETTPEETTPEETSPSEEPTTPEETTPTEPTTPSESPENPTTPSRPSGGGGGGGGRDRDRNPSVTPEPTPIPPEEVPLANIDPEDVPLAMMPSESPAEAMVIDDEGVPLFGLPRTGDRGVATGALIGMMLLSLMAACGIHVKKRKEEE